jgi:hypothetical protein
VGYEGLDAFVDMKKEQANDLLFFRQQGVKSDIRYAENTVNFDDDKLNTKAAGSDPLPPKNKRGGL